MKLCKKKRLTFNYKLIKKKILGPCVLNMNDKFLAAFNQKSLFNNYKRIESNIKHNNQNILNHGSNNFQLYNENNNSTKITNLTISEKLINQTNLIFYNAESINKSQIQIISTTPFMSNINNNNNIDNVIGFFEVSTNENCVDVNEIMYAIGDWTLRLDVQVCINFIKKNFFFR